MILPLIFLFLQCCFFLFILFLLIAFVTGAPFVPTKNDAADSMIRLARIKKGETVYDLGSGDGKLLLRAKMHGARCIGYEINPLLALWATIRGARTRWKNFWHADIHDADVIFIYLLPWKMDTLATKIRTQCKKGTRIVSNSFIFPGWRVTRQDLRTHIYVFTV